MTDVVEQSLAAWMRPLGSASERISAVLSGLQDLGMLGAGAGIRCTQLAYGLADADAAEQLRTAIAAHDASFVGAADDLETRICAAALVLRALDGPDGWLVAIAIQSAEFIGLARPIPDLPARAAEVLVLKSRELRKHDAIDPPKIADSLKSLDYPDGVAVDAPQLRALIEAVRKTRDNMILAFKALSSDVDLRLRAANEETEVLAWVVAGRLNGNGEDYHEVGSLAPIAAGFDLSSRLSWLVPIEGVAGILRRQVGSIHVALGEAVSAFAASGRSAPQGPRNPLTPVLSALDAAVEVDGDPSWMVRLRKVSAIDLGIERAADEIAVQIIREVALAKEW